MPLVLLPKTMYGGNTRHSSEFHPQHATDSHLNIEKLAQLARRVFESAVCVLRVVQLVRRAPHCRCKYRVKAAWNLTPKHAVSRCLLQDFFFF